MVFLLLTSIISIKIFLPIFLAEELIISYGINPFDICSKNPELWKIIKITYIICFIFSQVIISNVIYTNIIEKILFYFNSKKKSKKNSKKIPSYNKNELSLLIGYDSKTNSNVIVPESGLYQNFLITGTIGSGKTSSSMYPFTKQLLMYNKNNRDKKIGMLVLDVKGNYYRQVYEYAKKFDLLDNIIVIGPNSNTCYNPLHKPHLKPQVLANRLKTILLLFSENNSESYWLDKAEEVLTECIKLCRLYNDGYVTFLELHKLITIPNYYKEKLAKLKELFVSNKLSDFQIYELNSSLDFFNKEFENLDSRTKAILVSEITRITNTFISDYDVMKTFCSPKNKLSFQGFSNILKSGKIVVLDMNISEYAMLSKIIATYLKLDFQSEVISNLSKNSVRPSAFICDEYDKFATKTDSEFFSMSREAKCINIVSTQSYSSLKTTIKDDSQVKVIIQNLINKIWYRTDDSFTIEEAQKQLGKEDKEKVSKSISENANKTSFSYITKNFQSDNSNISESYSTYTQNEYIYESRFFSRDLETFTALTFLSDGKIIYPPKKLEMYPYFKDKI